MNILQLLEREEGYRVKPYYCTEGYPTVGIGKRIGPKNAPLDVYQFEVSLPVAHEWLREEVYAITAQMPEWFYTLTASRQTIILSMAYQLGVTGLLKFKNMIKALQRCDWDEAERQALDSRWAKQTPARAKRHAEALRTGVIV